MRSWFPNPPSLGLAASPARAARERTAPGRDRKSIEYSEPDRLALPGFVMGE
jgi:hypothetical protein